MKIEAKRKDAMICGIDLVAGDKLCKANTTLNQGFCRVSPSSHRCVFQTNPKHSNKSYTLLEIRHIFDGMRASDSHPNSIDVSIGVEIDTDADANTKPQTKPTESATNIHTLTPAELSHWMKFLDVKTFVSGNYADHFAPPKNHVACKFCSCVAAIRTLQKVQTSTFPAEYACRYSILKRRGLAWNDGVDCKDRLTSPREESSIPRRQSDLLDLSSLSSAGIQNDSNTCYMNSVLQLLYSMTSIRECVNSQPASLMALKESTGGNPPLSLGEYNRMLDMTAALRDVFAGLNGKQAVSALSANNHSHYHAINGVLPATDQQRVGVQGSADEVLGVLLDLIGSLYPDTLREYSLTESSYAACNDDAVLREQRVVATFPFVTPNKGLDTVQDLIDQAHEHVQLDNVNGCEKSQGHAYVKYESYTTDDARSKYVVVVVRRQVAVLKGSTFRDRFDQTHVQPSIITLGKSTYQTIGAILHLGSRNKHYVFVRTRGPEIIRLYNDGSVYSHERAVAYMKRYKINVNTNATVLLYQRTSA